MIDDKGLGVVGLWWRMGGMWFALALVFGLFLMGIWLSKGRIAAQLEEDGVVAQATVLAVERRPQGVDANGQPRIGWITRFRWTTEEGQPVEGRIIVPVSARRVTPPTDLGAQFPVRYSRSDPSVFETGIGSSEREAGVGLWGALGVLGLAVAYGVWIAIRAAGAVAVRDRGQAVHARVINGPAGERPPRVHLELPDGRKIKSRLTPLRGGYPKVGSTSVVYTRGKATWWEGEFRSKT